MNVDVGKAVLRGSMHVTHGVDLQAPSKYSASTGLYQRLTTGIAYLNKQGYCYQGDCQVFPVMWGEFGSRLQDPKDLQVRAPFI